MPYLSLRDHMRLRLVSRSLRDLVARRDVGAQLYRRIARFIGYSEHLAIGDPWKQLAMILRPHNLFFYDGSVDEYGRQVRVPRAMIPVSCCRDGGVAAVLRLAFSSDGTAELSGLEHICRRLGGYVRYGALSAEYLHRDPIADAVFVMREMSDGRDGGAWCAHQEGLEYWRVSGEGTTRVSTHRRPSLLLSRCDPSARLTAKFLAELEVRYQDPSLTIRFFDGVSELSCRCGVALWIVGGSHRPAMWIAPVLGRSAFVPSRVCAETDRLVWCRRFFVSVRWPKTRVPLLRTDRYGTEEEEYGGYEECAVESPRYLENGRPLHREPFTADVSLTLRVVSCLGAKRVELQLESARLVDARRTKDGMPAEVRQASDGEHGPDPVLDVEGPIDSGLVTFAGEFEVPVPSDIGRRSGYPKELREATTGSVRGSFHSAFGTVGGLTHSVIGLVIRANDSICFVSATEPRNRTPGEAHVQCVSEYSPV